MPKYTVEDVLEIIKTLTSEEKKSLATQLPTVLNSRSTEVKPPSRNQQSQSFGNIAIGNSSAFDVNQIAAEGSVNLGQEPVTSEEIQAEIKKALDLVELIKQEVDKTDQLNKLEKKNAEASISVIEEELKKPKPDKNLLTQAGNVLGACVKGAAEFAEPTMTLAALIAGLV
jgi:RNA-binding protein YhbY